MQAKSILGRGLKARVPAQEPRPTFVTRRSNPTWCCPIGTNPDIPRAAVKTASRYSPNNCKMLTQIKLRIIPKLRNSSAGIGRSRAWHWREAIDKYSHVHHA